MLTSLLDCEPERSKAASAAAERFRRDFDAEVIGPRLRSFLLGKYQGSDQLSLTRRATRLPPRRPV